MTTPDDKALRQRAYEVAAAVVDPELPMLTIADLGILRDVTVDNGMVEVAITPSYSGCPAMMMITADIEAALARAGFSNSRVRTVLSPAWTSDWLTGAARAKLAAAGIAPPSGAPRRTLFGAASVSCPHCGSNRTERISEFGSTACKALYRCLDCREPFDAFKCH
ncbi:MAG: 1,2-phenylacetyl-CoA epoxidase subunit PaaD [Acetobacteraceae bacterium]